MLAIFLKTVPFFALIGVGWAAARLRFFPPEATHWLTQFVFYFALSAMLFRFCATLDIATLWDTRFVLAYLTATALVWALGFHLARRRGEGLAAAGMEAQCCTVGNTGFLGVPMLLVLLGEAAVGPVLLVLVIDLVVFSTLITLLVTADRQGRFTVASVRPLLSGLVRNPMIVAMVAGLGWSWLRLPMPAPMADFLALLGGAATPGALFVIGASLGAMQPARLGLSAWLAAAKLVIHPAAVALAALVFRVDPQMAGFMVAAAALPVAGNTYILASHFGVGAQRVSTAILLSTAASIVTLPPVIAWVSG